MSGSITGQVLNQRDGQPIAGATCRLAPANVEKQTDRSGNFDIENLAASNYYELVVSKEGFDDGIYGPLVVIDEHATQLTLVLQPKDI